MYTTLLHKSASGRIHLLHFAELVYRRQSVACQVRAVYARPTPLDDRNGLAFNAVAVMLSLKPEGGRMTFPVFVPVTLTSNDDPDIQT